MFRKFVCASALMLSVAAGAVAQDTTVSAGLGRADFDGIEFDMAVVRGGYFFNENFGIEGELGLGLNDKGYQIGSTAVDLDLNYAAAVFGVYRFEVSEGINLLARAGYVQAELEASVAGFNVNDDDGAFAAGFAGEYFFDNVNGVRFDYTWADYDVDTRFYGLSYVRKLGG